VAPERPPTAVCGRCCIFEVAIVVARLAKDVVGLSVAWRTVEEAARGWSAGVPGVSAGDNEARRLSSFSWREVAFRGVLPAVCGAGSRITGKDNEAKSRLPTSWDMSRVCMRPKRCFALLGACQCPPRMSCTRAPAVAPLRAVAARGAAVLRGPCSEPDGATRRKTCDRPWPLVLLMSWCGAKEGAQVGAKVD